ncbi:MAG: hypothetical protein JSS02_35515 [Planctomycetes bacterium]|nr:hypothetical protein [Planctomycetota bacterium]
MNDDTDVEAVERSGEQLREMILMHLEFSGKSARSRTPTSFEELTLWFQGLQQRLQSLNLDINSRDYFALRLRDRYQELSEELLEKLRP